MAQSLKETTDTESIEAWFVQSMVSKQNCSMTSTNKENLCPGYYKYFAAAADWRAVTILFSLVLICAFIGVAWQKKG